MRVLIQPLHIRKLKMLFLRPLIFTLIIFGFESHSYAGGVFRVSEQSDGVICVLSTGTPPPILLVRYNSDRSSLEIYISYIGGQKQEAYSGQLSKVKTTSMKAGTSGVIDIDGQHVGDAVRLDGRLGPFRVTPKIANEQFLRKMMRGRYLSIKTNTGWIVSFSLKGFTKSVKECKFWNTYEAKKNKERKEAAQDTRANNIKNRSYSCIELNKLWTSKYYNDLKIHTDTTGDGNVPWEKRPFGCDDDNPSDDYRVAVAMYYLDHLKHIRNGKQVGFDWYAYVTDSALKFTHKVSEVGNNTYATAYNGLGIIHLSTKFFQAPLDIRNVATLVHERRHLDKQDPGHVVCNKNTEFTGSEKACDEKYIKNPEKSGAYSYGVNYLHYVDQQVNTQQKNDLKKSTTKYYIREHIYSKFNNTKDREIRELLDLYDPNK